MVNKKTDDMNETNKTTKKTVRRKTTKKKEAAAKPALSEKERQALALQHIQQLLQTGQKKGSLTYTEIMNLMEEDDLTPDQIDKMYELFADKGIDIIGEDDSMAEHDETEGDKENGQSGENGCVDDLLHPQHHDFGFGTHSVRTSERICYSI